MKILSIQVGVPQSVIFNGESVETAIFKLPITGPVQLQRLNIVGDGQADLTVHGGQDKAVYAYSYDTYPWWQKTRPQDQFNHGAFGENLSLDCLDEDNLFVGDTFAVGGAVIQVTEPRFPCFKLAIKFNDQAILKQFMQLNRPGSYFRVLQEGPIAAGLDLRLIDREQRLVSILELFNLSRREASEERRFRIAEMLQLKTLNEGWRRRLTKLLQGGE